MGFRRAFWGFILALAVVDFTVAALIALHPHQQATLVFAFALIQLVAFGLVALGFLLLLRNKKKRLNHSIRLVKTENSTNHWPVIALAALGVYALLNLLYTVTRIAGSDVPWRWYQVVSLCSGLLVSTVWIYLAYFLLRKGPTKH